MCIDHKADLLYKQINTLLYLFIDNNFNGKLENHIFLKQLL